MHDAWKWDIWAWMYGKHVVFFTMETGLGTVEVGAL